VNEDAPTSASASQDKPQREREQPNAFLLPLVAAIVVAVSGCGALLMAALVFYYRLTGPEPIAAREFVVPSVIAAGGVFGIAAAIAILWRALSRRTRCRES
jgi:membrane associated rhomboid family serine protease